MTWIHERSGLFVDAAGRCVVQYRDGWEDPAGPGWAIDEIGDASMAPTEIRRFADLADALEWARLTYRAVPDAQMGDACSASS